jgi:predicted HicB family RNase H-like nuclease
MKRIINGASYNTETSTEIAKYEYDIEPGEGAGFEVLYQTRGGAFFTHACERRVSHDEAAPNGQLVREINSFNPMTRDEAQDWVMTGNVEVFSDVFGELPEAAAEAGPEATLYVRVPTSLKDRIEAVALAAGQSVNAWAIRCLESGAATAA